MDLLGHHFGEQLISRFGPVNWPPRSCDITPLDFFLWGYVKAKVYWDKLATIEALEANIERVVREIPFTMLEHVIENWCERMDHLKASCGQHMKGIIF
uniref:Putative LOC100569746 [Acyrthosiphon pisum] n=1 Tax=Lepeophtheirus salmonis TaxID=72036 RepID=A0A0K2UFW6_LEPSM